MNGANLAECFDAALVFAAARGLIAFAMFENRPAIFWSQAALTVPGTSVIL